jgi:hypothetical protein
VFPQLPVHRAASPGLSDQTPNAHCHAFGTAGPALPVDHVRTSTIYKSLGDELRQIIDLRCDVGRLTASSYREADREPAGSGVTLSGKSAQRSSSLLWASIDALSPPELCERDSRTVRTKPTARTLATSARRSAFGDGHGLWVASRVHSGLQDTTRFMRAAVLGSLYRARQMSALRELSVASPRRAGFVR